MKEWDEARTAGTCAYNVAHTWKAGDRVYVVHPAGTRARRYCAGCAVTRHGAPPDPGTVLDVTDAPRYPTPLKQLADQAAERFDARAAAARNDD